MVNYFLFTSYLKGIVISYVVVYIIFEDIQRDLNEESVLWTLQKRGFLLGKSICTNSFQLK